VSPWLAATFTPPAGLELPSGHHLRPIRASDVDLDYAAVMGSRTRLFSIFGRAWGWPPDPLSYEQDRAELVRHADEMVALASFNYAVFDRDETVLLGCVYVDPPEKIGADADISWWVVDAEVDGALASALRDEVPAWIATAWPFTDARFVGETLTWDEYLALPDLEGS
jgi:hypothetical protein